MLLLMGRFEYRNILQYFTSYDISGNQSMSTKIRTPILEFNCLRDQCNFENTEQSHTHRHTKKY